MANWYKTHWPDWFRAVYRDAGGLTSTYFRHGLWEEIQDTIIAVLAEGREKDGKTHEELVRLFETEVGKFATMGRNYE